MSSDFKTIEEEIAATGVLSLKNPTMNNHQYIDKIDNKRRSWVVYYRPSNSLRSNERSWKIVKARSEEGAIKVFRDSSLYCSQAEIFQITPFTRMIDIPEHANVLNDRMVATMKERHHILMRKVEQDIALVALAEVENIAEATRIAKANAWPGKFIPENPTQYIISIMCSVL